MIQIPEQRMYDRNHAWIEMEDEFIGRCGLSERHLQKLDIIEFIEFPEVDAEVRKGEQVALLESNIDICKYRSPVSGRITEINHRLEFEPRLINEDPYGEGWIYKIDVKEPVEFDDLMTDDGYAAYLENS